VEDGKKSNAAYSLVWGKRRGKERSGERGGRRPERRDGEEGGRFEVRVGSHRSLY